MNQINLRLFLVCFYFFDFFDSDFVLEFIAKRSYCSLL